MPSFRDTPAVAERFNNNPDRIVSMLEGILTADQVAAIENVLFPVADEATRTRALVEARKVLLRAGLRSDDSVVVAIDNELVVA